MSGGATWPAALRERAANLDWGQLERYAEELERWNRAIRLVGPRDLSGIRIQIADALLPFLLWPPEFPLLDLGSGAGLPGIPVAIACPRGEIVCLEPQPKRVSFLRHAVRVLRLGSVRVVAARAEEAALSAALAGAFATVTGRAVAGAAQFLSLARPFVRPLGRVAVLRGERGAPTVEGWDLVSDESYDGPEGVGSRSVAIYVNEVAAEPFLEGGAR